MQVIGNQALIPRYTIRRVPLTVTTYKEIEHEPSERLVAISFKNTGDDPVTLNNSYELAANSAMITFEGDLNCIDATKYEIRFAGTGSSPRLEVWKTFVAKIEVERVPITTIEKI